ncbi:MAG TPA: 50S ribosomal protein L11 methyltransferase, partial [Chryseolinea sp.]
MSFYSRLQVTCDPKYTEILMAELAEAGFETFMETDGGFEAYVEMENYDKELLEFIKEKYGAQTPLAVHQDRIEKKNW